MYYTEPEIHPLRQLAREIIEKHKKKAIRASRPRLLQGHIDAREPGWEQKSKSLNGAMARGLGATDGEY